MIQPPHTHLAEINIGRTRGTPESPVMREFVEKTDAINALAERSPGFVWRLTGEGNNAMDVRYSDDPLEAINLSVWGHPQTLRTMFGRRPIKRSTTARPNGLRRHRSRILSCGGCRSAMSPRSKRRSNAWNTTASTARHRMPLVGSICLRQSSSKSDVVPNSTAYPN